MILGYALGVQKLKGIDREKMMDFESIESPSEFVTVIEDIPFEEETKASKQKKYQARRKIEDLIDLKRIREELGWLDGIDAELAEEY